MIRKVFSLLILITLSGLVSVMAFTISSHFPSGNIKVDSTRNKRTFSYTFTTNKPVRFSMSMPYTRTQFLKFIKPYLKLKNVKLDIHCPWIRFGDNDHAFSYGTLDSKKDLEIKEFCKLLKINNSNELKISENFYVAEAPPTSPGLSSRRWFSAYSEEFGVKLPLTIEFPYATNNGQNISQQNSRAFGEDVAKALKAYLIEK